MKGTTGNNMAIIVLGLELGTIILASMAGKSFKAQIEH